MNLYTYCGNNPINFWDPSGHEAGDIFDSRDAAAKDFSKIYATESEGVDKDWEWFAYVYKKNDGKYSYTEPVHSKSGEKHWSVPMYREIVTDDEYAKTKPVGGIHTHGKYNAWKGDAELRLSTDDESWSYNKKMPFYLANAAGELLMYDYKGFTKGEWELGQVFKITDSLPKLSTVKGKLTGYHPHVIKEQKLIWKIWPWNWGKCPYYRDLKSKT